MAYLTLDDKADEENGEEDTNGRIEENQEVAAKDRRDAELEEPLVGEMDEVFEHDSSQTGEKSYQNTEEKEEHAVADVTHTPHNETLIKIIPKHAICKGTKKKELAK